MVLKHVWCARSRALGGIPVSHVRTGRGVRFPPSSQMQRLPALVHCVVEVLVSVLWKSTVVLCVSKVRRKQGEGPSIKEAGATWTRGTWGTFGWLSFTAIVR